MGAKGSQVIGKFNKTQIQTALVLM